MKRIFFILLVLCSTFRLELLGAVPEAVPAPPPSAPAKRSAAELEKLALPIALHPDPLLAILLPAAVYPVEIVQAARFVKDTNNIPKLDDQPWDENVRAVAKFPQLIAQMDADLSWTMALGQAFLDQPKELMDTIQALRGKAQKAGTLQNTPQQVITVTNTVVEKIVEQQTVVVTNTIVQIQPSNPQVVYVPTYPPTVYYPPPAYVYDPYAPLVTFGVGLAVGAIVANNWNHCDWHGGGVYHGDVNINNVNVNRNNNFNQNNNFNRNNTAQQRSGGQQKWQPDQNRLRSSGAAPTAQNREARGWSGSGAGGAAGAGAGARPSQGLSGGGAGARPAQQPAGNRSPGVSAGTQPARSPGAGQSASAAQRPSSSGGGARPSATQSPSLGRSSAQSSSAFSGVGNSSSARASSSRGSSSFGGGGGGGGRAGGGGRGGGGGGRGGRR